MLTRIWKTYKKQCIIAIVALAAVLIPLYLYFMFQTGIWYQDAFLVEQRDGSFQGKKDGMHYVLHITPTQNGAQIDFSGTGKTDNMKSSRPSWMESPLPSSMRTVNRFLRAR